MGLVKDVIKEIENKSREFYEFILPPIDMFLDENNLKIVIDIPGFSKKDIELTINDDILSIKAQKVIGKEVTQRDGVRRYLFSIMVDLMMNCLWSKQEGKLTP